MSYPHLFSEWQIRNTTIPNRVVFAPTCPTWVASPYDGVFTDQAVAYYEERAKGGCGLIIIGLGDGLVCSSLKKIVNRPRPYQLLASVRLPRLQRNGMRAIGYAARQDRPTEKSVPNVATSRLF